MRNLIGTADSQRPSISHFSISRLLFIEAEFSDKWISQKERSYTIERVYTIAGT